MTALLHVGIEHPDAVWLLVTALVGFAAGGVAMYRSSRSTDDRSADGRASGATDEDR